MHWLVRIAERASNGEHECPEISAGAAASDAWSVVARSFDLSDAQLAVLVAEYFRLNVANLAQADPDAASLIPETMVRKHGVFPLAEDDRNFIVATCDPTNVEAERALGFSIGRTLVFEVAPPGVIQDALDERFSPERAVESLLGGLRDVDEDAVKLVDEIGPESISEDDAWATPVVKLTNLIIRDAITAGASDIHIEPARRLGARLLPLDVQGVPRRVRDARRLL